MAEGLQIGQLPQKENLTGNELIPFQQGSSNGSMSTATLKKYIGTGGGTGGSTDYMNYITEYNVSVQHPTSGIDGSNKYSLEGAIAQVPQELRNIGLKVSFINSDGKVETWEFQGGTVVSNQEWVKDTNWIKMPNQKQITELDARIKVLGNLDFLESHTFSGAVNPEKNKYALPFLKENEKFTLLLKSDQAVTSDNVLIFVKFNNKTSILKEASGNNLDIGIPIEHTPTSDDLSNNNDANYIEVSIYNNTNPLRADLYFLWTSSEVVDNFNNNINTLVNAKTTNIVLTEEYFNNKGNFDFSSGIIKYNANTRCTSFLKLGTSKRVLCRQATSQYNIFVYDAYKRFMYFLNISSGYDKEKEYTLGSSAEYICISGGNNTNKLPLGTIIYDVPKEYDRYNIAYLRDLSSCPSKVFTYEEFFNVPDTYIKSFASEPEYSAVNNARVKLDVKDYIGIQISNRALCPLYEYDDKGNCVAYYDYQHSGDDWFARGVIRFHPETRYISSYNNKMYRTNIVLYKMPSKRNYIQSLDDTKFSRTSRITVSAHFGDSTSDEGWSDSTNKEVCYWNLAARMLGILPKNMAKAASSFLPFKGSGSAAGMQNTAIYDKTRLLSDFVGLITVMGGTNDYNGGWDGSVWGAEKSVDRVSKIMLLQDNGKEMFKELSVKKFEDLLSIEKLVEDHDNHYFEEAFMYTMWDLKLRNPKALIVCISPFGRIGEEYPNIVGAKLQDYRDAEKRICQLLGIPFLDVQEVVGGVNHTFYYDASSTKPESAAEGLHPNADGHKIAGAWMTMKIRDYIDMWDLLNNGYMDTLYAQGQSKGAAQLQKTFVKEIFELTNFIE